MKKKTLQNLIFIGAILVCVVNAVLSAADSGSATLRDGTTAHFIDVGQGDSTLLVSGQQAVLIDAGTAASSDTILSYLKEQGVKELFAVVATHPHADHIGSMADIIRTFPIGHFYLGPETTNTSSYSTMLEALEEAGISPQLPKDGDMLAFASGATLTFLGPADDVPADNLNNRSLITLFEDNGRSILLMGDAEQPAESSLLSHHPSLACDILKVGHHGSDTASSVAFLQSVRPKTAVISCGLGNDYGHPSPQTLTNLSDAGVTNIRMTAKEGNVVILFELTEPTEKTEKEETAA